MTINISIPKMITTIKIQSKTKKLINLRHIRIFFNLISRLYNPTAHFTLQTLLLSIDRDFLDWFSITLVNRRAS